MLLKRITSHLPDHLQLHIPLLESANIKTTEHLLFTPFSTLIHLTPDIPEHHLKHLILHCSDLTAPERLTGAEVMKRLAERKSLGGWSGWGIEGLDRLIGGEEWDGVGVVEVCGPKRVGKSLLAQHAALRRLVMDEKVKCRWLDTEGSFSPGRARAILESWGVEDTRSVLDRLVVTPCFRLNPDMFDAISAVEAELESSGSSDEARTCVLVIDPITNFFKDILTNTSAQGHAAMITVMEEIATLTQTYGLTTIICNAHASSLPTNPNSAFSTTTIKPALGTAFTYTTDITLLAQETGKIFGMVDEEERERIRVRPGLRGVVEVFKSHVSPAGRWAVFETDGTRLYDVLPPPTEDERTMRMTAGLPTGVQRPKFGGLAETLAE